MERRTVSRVAATLLLSIALLVNAAAQLGPSASATQMIARAGGDSLPLLGEPMDIGDENLPAPGPSYLQPTIFRPSLFIPAAQRSASRTANSTKNDIKLYQLNGVLLI